MAELEAVDESTLSARERNVLRAIVELHIDRREPVGSKTLASVLEDRVSPATVRSVMSALMTRGLIQKPHSSAGRVPTDRGFRFYVDALLKLEEPPASETETLQRHIRDAGTIDGAVEEAARVLSQVSRHACLVRAPRPEQVRVRHLELVPLREDALLLVVVSESGMVHNQLLEPRGKLRQHLGEVRLLPEELNRISRALTAECAGQSIGEVRQRLRLEMEAEGEATRRLATELLGEAIEGLDEAVQKLPLTVEGSSHLLEHLDPDRLEHVRELYSMLEQKQQLVDVLVSAEQAPGIRIFIGQESGLGELADMTLVTATYGRGADIFGSLGVLGPMHLDYSRVIPLVAFTAETVSSVLE